jgi:hypothetical protein
MKRSELVDRLIKEGMSEKTLVKFTDKQLNNLANRMLGEAVTTTADALSKSVALQNLAKKQDIKLVGEEGEVSEELKGKQKNLDKNHNGKIDGQDFKILKGQKKTEDKKCDDCGKSIKDCKCDHSHMDESKEVKNWVESLAEENFHSFTSKNEIMELINIKLNESEVHQYGPNVKTGHNGLPEFMTYDTIVSNDPKIAPAKPKVDPGTKPVKPKTPFQPGPGPNPKPKALREKEVNEDGPKIAPAKPKVDPGTKPVKPKTPFQPGPGPNPKPKALREDKK